MNTDLLQRLGVAEIGGADVYGGQVVNPWILGVTIGVTVSACSAIINNWSTFTRSLAQGWSDGSSGNI